MEEIKSINHFDLEDLVYRMELTYDENMVILETNQFPSKKLVVPYRPEFKKAVILTER